MLKLDKLVLFTWTLTLLFLMNPYPYQTGVMVDGGRAKKEPRASISSYAPGGQYIMLTFDDGPHHTATSKFLHILKEKGVKATFFMLGRRLHTRGHLLKQLVRDGHDVQNNGYNSFTNNGEDAIGTVKKGILHTSGLIHNMTKLNTSFYRPYTSQPDTVYRDIQSGTNHKIITWSLESSSNNAGSIVEAVKSKAKPGDIIRLHNTPTSVEALPFIIDFLLNESYELLTISQVASFPDDSPH